MSNTEGNVEKSARRHWGPIFGISLVLVFALGAFVWWLYYEVDQSESPAGAPVQVDGRTGQTREVDPTVQIPAQDGEDIESETVP